MLGWDDPDRRDVALERLAERLAQPDPLSKNELATVLLVSHGLPYREIGETLHLAPETVRDNMRRARQKLGTSSRVHAVATALRLGLIS